MDIDRIEILAFRSVSKFVDVLFHYLNLIDNLYLVKQHVFNLLKLHVDCYRSIKNWTGISYKHELWQSLIEEIGQDFTIKEWSSSKVHCCWLRGKSWVLNLWSSSVSNMWSLFNCHTRGKKHTSACRVTRVANNNSCSMTFINFN